MIITHENLSLKQTNDEISEYIKNMRSSAGLTTYEFAKRLGVTKSLLRDLEFGNIRRWFRSEGNYDDLITFLENVKRVAVHQIRRKRENIV